jgi:purine nucleoside permease
MSREAMEMALEALESDPISHAGLVNRKQAITALRQALETEREWVGLNHFDRTLLRTTYAPLKRLHHIKETNTDIVEEIINDWDAFFTAIEAKLKEKNHG